MRPNSFVNFYNASVLGYQDIASKISLYCKRTSILDFSQLYLRDAVVNTVVWNIAEREEIDHCYFPNQQRWSPRGRPWPRGHILKSLASKPQVLENCPVLGSRTALFLKPLKFRWKTLETLWKICKDLFLVSSSRDRLNKNFWKPFFFFFFENTCVYVLGPWPREGLSLASNVSLALACASLMSSTPPLQINIEFSIYLFPFFFHQTKSHYLNRFYFGITCAQRKSIFILCEEYLAILF